MVEATPETRQVILGTRGSPLAMAQSRQVKGRVEATSDAAVDVHVIRTTGDRIRDRALPEIGDTGLFTAELDRALLEGEIDVAVHSLKDLPTVLEPGLELATVPTREDPRDVLVVADRGGTVTLRGLPLKAVVGTGSVRRKAWALAVRPDLDVRPIRGNVGTRLEKLEAGAYDALVLAGAGLRRLGLGDRAGQWLDRTHWTPAPGQGALGLVARTGDEATIALLAPLEHTPTRAAVTLERAFLSGVGAGCSLPVGAIGLPFDGGIRGWAMVASPDGQRVLRVDRTGRATDALVLGRLLAEILMDRGAGELLAAVPQTATSGGMGA